MAGGAADWNRGVPVAVDRSKGVYSGSGFVNSQNVTYFGFSFRDVDLSILKT